MGFFFQAKAAMLATQSKQLPSSLISACQMYPESVLLTSFFAVFGVVIALMKDVPDVEVPCRRHCVWTFTLILTLIPIGILNLILILT